MIEQIDKQNKQRIEFGMDILNQFEKKLRKEDLEKIIIRFKDGSEYTLKFDFIKGKKIECIKKVTAEAHRRGKI